MGYFLVFFGMHEGAPWCRVERIPPGQGEHAPNQVVLRFISDEGITNDARDRHIEPRGRQVAAALRRAAAAPDRGIRHRLHISFMPGPFT
jgi:hypothetical protein